MKCKNIIALATSILVSISAVLMLVGYIESVLSQFPKSTVLNYNLAADKEPVTISFFEKLSDRVSSSDFTFCSELDMQNIGEQTVVPVLTNENYFEQTAQRIMYGGALSEDDISNGSRRAVISSDLALKLFFNRENAVGKSVVLFDEEYKIAGVYEEREAFLDKLNTDGKQRVYIPYTSYKDYGKQPVQSMAYGENAISAALYEQMDFSQYYKTDFNEKALVLATFEHIVLLFIFLFFAILLLRLWYALSGRLYRNIRSSLGEKYFFKSFKSIPHRYALYALVGIGVPALIIAIFLMCDFSINIPSKYMPYDNIFDFSHYADMILANASEQNSLALTGGTYLIRLYASSFNFCLASTVVVLLCLAVCFAVANKALSSGIKRIRQ